MSCFMREGDWSDELGDFEGNERVALSWRGGHQRSNWKLGFSPVIKCWLTWRFDPYDNVHTHT